MCAVLFVTSGITNNQIWSKFVTLQWLKEFMYVIIEPFQGTNIPLNTLPEDIKVTCGAEVVPPEVESYTIHLNIPSNYY